MTSWAANQSVVPSKHSWFSGFPKAVKGAEPSASAGRPSQDFKVLLAFSRVKGEGGHNCPACRALWNNSVILTVVLLLSPPDIQVFKSLTRGMLKWWNTKNVTWVRCCFTLFCWFHWFCQWQTSDQQKYRKMESSGSSARNHHVFTSLVLEHHLVTQQANLPFCLLGSVISVTSDYSGFLH